MAACYSFSKTQLI